MSEIISKIKKKECLVLLSKNNEVDKRTKEEKKELIQGHYGIEASFVYQCENEKNSNIALIQASMKTVHKYIEGLNPSRDHFTSLVIHSPIRALIDPTYV